jgi:hypothetical protein
MSSASNPTSTQTSFKTLFDAALAKYTKRTGKDLHDHPLAALIHRCQSPDSVLAIFHEQSRAFDEFRNDDPKLIKWLSSIVDGLHAISTNAALSAGASFVSPIQFPHSTASVLLQRLLLGVLSYEPCFLWYCRPPLCAYYSRPLPPDAMT